MCSRLAIFSLMFAVPLMAQTAAPDLRGVYIYTNDVSTLSKSNAAALTQSLSVPGVDGVAVAIGWNAIEPSMGQYSFAILDQWLAEAIALERRSTW